MQYTCPVFSSEACPALKYFSTPSHKRDVLRGEKVTEHEMCVLDVYTNFVSDISHSKKNWARCDKKYVLVFM